MMTAWKAATSRAAAAVVAAATVTAANAMALTVWTVRKARNAAR